MFRNSLQDVPFISDYYGEYLQHVVRYKNLKRPSIFCRYLKVNRDASTFHPDTKGTDDRYYSGVKYDAYEYTPGYSITPTVDEAQDNQQKQGRRFSGGSRELVIYTIDKPTHNDLVMFPYDPNNSTSCYRVMDIGVHLNALDQDVKYTRLTLEKAPVDHTKVKYLNSYVYLMPQEHYVPTKKYIRITQEYEKFQEIFKILENGYWDEVNELYFYIYNGKKIAPLKQNLLIYKFLADRRHNTRYFTHTKIPFGIMNYSEESIDDADGYDLVNKRNIEMGETNNPIILGYLSFLNQYTFPFTPFKVQYYYFVDGRPQYGLDNHPEFSDNILKYEINTETLLMDLGSLIYHFKG